MGVLGGLDLTTLVSLSGYVLFFLFFAFGGRIQGIIATSSIVKSLNRLDRWKNEARQEVINYVGKNGKNEIETGERVDELLNYVTIMPTNTDPTGIVPKIEHLANTGEQSVRGEIVNLMKGDDAFSVSVAQNMVEIASGLNLIHRVVRHYYLEGKKTNSSLTLMQLQMSLPQIMMQAANLNKAMGSIKSGRPIGDGVGPMVASRFLAGSPTQVVAKDTMVGTTQYEGRKLYVMKAEGPMGYVGQPGVAIERLVGEMSIAPGAIIMVDAAAKLEGEETGEVSEGVGAAIGGIGVEKFQIEEVAAKYKIPVYAVLVKEGDSDVMTTMKEEIEHGVERAAKVVGRLIREKTREGDTVLLAGIGNTLGVGQ